MKDKTVITAQTITELTGITTRCYKNGELISFFSNAPYPNNPKDLFFEYLPKVEESERQIGYVLVDTSILFGFVKNDPMIFVVGPIPSKQLPDDVLRSIAEKRSEGNKREEDYIYDVLKNSVPLSIQALIPSLIGIYMLIHFKKPDAAGEFELDPELSIELGADIISQGFSIIDDAHPDRGSSSTTFTDFFEDIVRSGNVSGMQDWLTRSPSMRFCIDTSSSPLRNAKNSFIVGSTLVFLAATEGGLDRRHAIAQHQKYLVLAEQCESEERVLDVQMKYFMETTEKVSKLKTAGIKTTLISEAINYIQQNIRTPLRIDDIASALFVSRAHLSAEFHSEIGQTISNYIRDEKIAEAKKLLKKTDLPLSAISKKLGFSSQSYFTRVFKTCTGITPKEYRRTL